MKADRVDGLKSVGAGEIRTTLNKGDTVVFLRFLVRVVMNLQSCSPWLQKLCISLKDSHPYGKCTNS